MYIYSNPFRIFNLTEYNLIEVYLFILCDVKNKTQLKHIEVILYRHKEQISTHLDGHFLNFLLYHLWHFLF